MKSNAFKFSLATMLLVGMAFSAAAQTPATVPAQATPAKAAPPAPAAAPASPATPATKPRKATIPAPDWLTKEIGKPIRLQGEGTLRFIGFAIYNARLWVPGSGFTYDNDFALDITYQQGTDKQGLVLATVPELGRFMNTNSAKLEAWTNDLKRVYPDIEVGDRFIAIWRKDQNVTRFYHNDKPTGDIMGADFAKAFFAIWLDPQTRRSDLRRALLSE